MRNGEIKKEGKERDKDENLPLNTNISNTIPLLGQDLLL